jgi:hypothetical protein
MHRREAAGSAGADGPPPLPADLDRDELQLPEHGAGPLFHRRYRIRMRDSDLGPEQLVALVAERVDRVAPTEFASFQKIGGGGDDERLRPGDEFVVRMPGPWDGPVRVVEVTAASFRLVTLAGHLEAGQIRFRAWRQGDLLAFEIESWARSGDRLSNLLYHHLRMSKEVQLHMWTSMLERIVKLAGGRRTGPLDVQTRRVDAAG